MGALFVVVTGCSSSGDVLATATSASSTTASTPPPTTALPTTVPAPSTAPATTVPPPSSAPPSAPSSAAPGPGEPATLVRVDDGDTIVVRTSADEATVRLVGVNAPERGECGADAATTRLRSLLGSPGPMRLARDVSDTDQYGRLLRYVEVDGLDVGGVLVREGFALARRYPPDLARAATYDAAQAAAEHDRVGLWARNACGPAAAAVLAFVVVHPDAAGDDNKNLNDEYVVLENRGSAPVDLTGWVVRDTSSSHRYTFRSLVLAPGARVTLRSGCGTETATERFWCASGSAIWNNSGDTAYLLDPSGNIVAQRGW